MLLDCWTHRCLLLLLLERLAFLQDRIDALLALLQHLLVAFLDRLVLALPNLVLNNLLRDRVDRRRLLLEQRLVKVLLRLRASESLRTDIGALTLRNFFVDVLQNALEGLLLRHSLQVGPPCLIFLHVLRYLPEHRRLVNLADLLRDMHYAIALLSQQCKILNRVKEQERRMLRKAKFWRSPLLEDYTE